MTIRNAGIDAWQEAFQAIHDAAAKSEVRIVIESGFDEENQPFFDVAFYTYDGKAWSDPNQYLTEPDLGRALIEVLP